MYKLLLATTLCIIATGCASTSNEEELSDASFCDPYKNYLGYVPYHQYKNYSLRKVSGKVKKSLRDLYSMYEHKPVVLASLSDTGHYERYMIMKSSISTLKWNVVFEGCPNSKNVEPDIVIKGSYSFSDRTNDGTYELVVEQLGKDVDVIENTKNTASIK